MRKHHVHRSLSGLVVLCSLGVFALATPAASHDLEELCKTNSPEIQEMARAGDAEMQWLLAYCYSKGWGVPKDDRRAVEWYQKCAKQGDSDCQFNLAIKYDTGRGVAKDARRAAELYQKAADQGVARAQYNLGVSYLNGEGVPKDKRRAVEWFKKAARQGDEDAQKALRRLGESW